MKLNKKALAILTGLTLSVSGTAFAAEAGADSFSDVPQGHWAYDALDFLAKDASRAWATARSRATAP